jgi:hypothetical protein
MSIAPFKKESRRSGSGRKVKCDRDAPASNIYSSIAGLNVVMRAQRGCRDDGKSPHRPCVSRIRGSLCMHLNLDHRTTRKDPAERCFRMRG